MTSSLLEGQLWIWGLTPTSLHPHPQESLRPTFGKAAFFSLGQGTSSTAGGHGQETQGVTVWPDVEARAGYSPSPPGEPVDSFICLVFQRWKH